jgi:hypothetical protein
VDKKARQDGEEFMVFQEFSHQAPGGLFVLLLPPLRKYKAVTQAEAFFWVIVVVTGSVSHADNRK